MTPDSATRYPTRQAADEDPLFSGVFLIQKPSPSPPKVDHVGNLLIGGTLGFVAFLGVYIGHGLWTLFFGS